MPTSEAAPRNPTVVRTITVALVVSFFCSLLVSAVAVSLRDVQQANEEDYRRRNILQVAGLYDPARPVDVQFDTIETRTVDLDSGDYVEQGDREALTTIPAAADVANIRSRPRFVDVYLVRDGANVSSIILPIYGSGLWSTMYGFIALAPDGNTVQSLTFYEHAETPGLGDKVEDPEWLSHWEGKLIFDASGEPQIEVVRGQVSATQGPGEPKAGDPIFQIDGMAGATLTGNGVTGTVQYWMGDHGFGPWLERYWHMEDGA